MDLLNLAYEAWSASAELRKRRERFKNFTYGRQWDDIVKTSAGMETREWELALRCGYHPQTNNLLRQLVKTVVGLYRKDYAAEVPQQLRQAWTRNCLDELDARTFEEYLISGCAIQRVVNEKRQGGEGVWVDMVNPRRFFVNRFEDPRGGDIELVGMLHDMSVAEAICRFGNTCPGGIKALRELLAAVGERTCGITGEIGTDNLVEFLQPQAGRVRLVELWTLEVIKTIRCYDPVAMKLFMCLPTEIKKVCRENRRRAESSRIIFKDYESLRWRCRWLTATGAVINDYLSSSRHCSHPFAVKFYPLVDGEVHPFIEDVIDQQRYINRMITLIDHVLQSSAKGVLLFPEDRKPAGYTWEDLCRMWSDCRGVIPLRNSPRTDQMPAQVVSSGSPEGAHKLLSTQLDLMERISGVSSGLSGKELKGNASAGLYEAYSEHSTTSLRDSLESYRSFLSQRNFLMLNT